MSEARLGIQLGVGLVAIALVAGCSTAPVPTPGGPSTPEPVAEGMLEDPAGDLIRWPGNQPVGTADYLDILGLVVVADETTLRLTLTLVGVVPAQLPPAIERLNYNIGLRTDDNIDRGPDGAPGGHSFTVALSRSTPSGGLQPVLWDLPFDADVRAIRYQGHEFPGTAVVADNTIAWTVRLEALGDPHVIQLTASANYTATTGSGDTFSVADHIGGADLDQRVLILDLAGGPDRPRPS